MARYSDYKDSGQAWLGMVPNHWDVLPGKALFSENKNKNTSNYESFVLSLSYGNIIPKKDINEGLVPENYSGYQIVDPGNIIIRCTDLQNDKVSLRTGIVKHHGIISGAYLGLICNLENSERFLHYLLHNWDISKELYRYGSGLRQSLSWKDIKYLQLAIPPKEEQEAIVSYLDRVTADIDKAIEAKERIIASLEERRKIIITHAVTRGINHDVAMRDSGIDWLGEIPAHWEIRRLRFLCDMKTGDKDTIMRKDDGKYHFFVRSPKIERINSYTFDTEAVLMAGDGAGAGKVFHYYKGKFGCHQRVYCLHNFSKMINPLFVYFQLSTKFREVFIGLSAKSTVDSVRLPMLKNFEMAIPPIEEQIQICSSIQEQLNPIDSAIIQQKKLIELLRERKNIIINETVTGKVKVL